MHNQSAMHSPHLMRGVVKDNTSQSQPSPHPSGFTPVSGGSEVTQTPPRPVSTHTPASLATPQGSSSPLSNNNNNTGKIR